MKNVVDEHYGYNDVISGLISKMCLEAYSLYDIEKERVNNRTAIARAIGHTIKKNIKIYTRSYHMDKGAIDLGLNMDDKYTSHIERSTFLEFANDIYESGNYRIEKYNNYYECVFKYQLAVFEIGELKWQTKKIKS